MIFVGEKPSKTAKENGWTWEDGRLAAKQLFDCLEMIGVDPEEHSFVNLWTYSGVPKPFVVPAEETIVGMGKIVQDELDKRGIEYIPIVHPAARGSIRKKENYAGMLKERLKNV